MKHVTINIINKCVKGQLLLLAGHCLLGASGICGVVFFNIMYKDTVHNILDCNKIK